MRTIELNKGEENGILSLSFTPMGKDENGKLTNADRVPGGNYFEDFQFDAELTISPDKQWQEPSGTFTPGKEYKGKMQAKSRGSIILHELIEIIKRAVSECSYIDAHADSISEEGRLKGTDSRRSKYPGVAN